MGLSHSPSIVTDGLDFYIDPNNIRCYPGFGNTVYNIINSSIGATLVGFTSALLDSTEARSFYFDGSNDSLPFSNSTSYSPTKISVCIWFKKAHGSSFKALIDKGRDNYGAWTLCVDETANKATFKAKIFYTSGINQSITTSSNYNSNSWNFVCGVYDGAYLSIYLNGVLSNAAYYLHELGNNSYPITIGAANDGYNVNANIGQAFVYGRALSAAEIQQLYHTTKKKYLIEENIVTDGLVLNLDPGNPNSYSGSGNTVFDLAGFGNTGTLVNGPAFSSLNSGSLSFDGTNDYMYVQHNNSQNITNITMSAWFNFPTVPFSGLGINKEGAYRLLAGESYTSTASGRIGDSWGTGVGPGSTTLRPNRWYQIVMTADGVTQKLYVNGSLDYTLNNSALASINSNVLSFATYHYGIGAFMNCRMSQALIYNRSLSAQEVQQNYNATKNRFINVLPPVRNGLVLELDAANTSSYSGFGNTWYDLSGNGYDVTLSNGPTFSGVGPTTYIVFDGSNDYGISNINKSIVGSSFTISFLLSVASSSYGCIFQFADQLVTGVPWIFLNRESSSLVNWYINGQYRLQAGLSTSENALISITYSNNLWTSYKNGAALGTTSTGIGGFSGNNLIFAYGYFAPTNSKFNLFTIHNRALSAYEIKQNFDFYRTRYGI